MPKKPDLKIVQTKTHMVLVPKGVQVYEVKGRIVVAHTDKTGKTIFTA